MGMKKVKLLFVFIAFISILYPANKLNAQEIDSPNGFIGTYSFYLKEKLKAEKIVPGGQKGLYMTGCSMGNPEKRREIYKLIQSSELNCIVFNAKDDSGYVDYNTDVKFAKEIGSEKKFYDLDEILDEMNSRNIYSIARVVVFKDSILPKAKPELAIKDSRTGKPLYSEGSYWPDIYCKQVWDYNIEIVKELAKEANYDLHIFFQNLRNNEKKQDYRIVSRMSDVR